VKDHTSASAFFSDSVCDRLHVFKNVIYTITVGNMTTQYVTTTKHHITALLYTASHRNMT